MLPCIHSPAPTLAGGSSILAGFRRRDSPRGAIENLAQALRRGRLMHVALDGSQALVPTYADRVERLSRMSVTKHFDAFADVAWDTMPIELDDPRWELGQDDPLGATLWYRERSADVRARIGLHVAVCRFAVGVEFESVLSRGLLEMVSTLSPDRPELRYAYHEVIEESQHSLMFLEFIRRTGLPAFGLGWLNAWGARAVPALGASFPEMFFLHVLAGETPIDLFQRNELKKGDALHPLARRIMQIHVIEEARHVCFASAFLDQRLPRLGAWKRWKIRTIAPLVLRDTAHGMLRPPSQLLRRYEVPRAVIREAYEGPLFRKQVIEGLAPIVGVCARAGILTPGVARLWSRFGIMEGGGKPLLP